MVLEGDDGDVVGWGADGEWVCGRGKRGDSATGEKAFIGGTEDRWAGSTFGYPHALEQSSLHWCDGGARIHDRLRTICGWGDRLEFLRPRGPHPNKRCSEIVRSKYKAATKIKLQAARMACCHLLFLTTTIFRAIRTILILESLFQFQSTFITLMLSHLSLC